jgi:hypothetical protein
MERTPPSRRLIKQHQLMDAKHMKKTRRRYDRHFEISAVAEIESGKPLAEIAREHSRAEGTNFPAVISSALPGVSTEIPAHQNQRHGILPWQSRTIPDECPRPAERQAARMIGPGVWREMHISAIFSRRGQQLFVRKPYKLVSSHECIPNEAG